ncbi:MAG: hypothetical protein AAGF11_43015 [Myxococcota bacterium]
MGALLVGSLAACTGREAPHPTAASALEPIVYECRDPSLVDRGVDHRADLGTSAYHFEIDGDERRPWSVSMTGRSRTIEPGDVVRVEDLPMVLGKPGHYHYFVEDEGRRVMLSVDDGPRQQVALAVTSVDQIAALTEQERADLRGVRLLGWGPAWGAELSRLALERVVVAYDRSDLLTGVRVSEPPHVPPGLPVGLRYLELGTWVLGAPALDEPARGLPGLARLSGLRYLSIDTSAASSLDRTSFDARWIRGLSALEVLRLDVWGRRVDHLDALGDLGQLRVLDVSALRELSDLGFVSSLEHLRVLDVHGAGVQSLAPLSGHPALEVLEAHGNPITELPAVPPPRLRSVSLMSTKLTAAAVDAFAQRVPGAHITHRPNQALADTLACADRIRVRTGGLCHRRREDERILFEVTDAAAVERARPLFRVAEDELLGTCMCCGEPTIELYRGDSLIAEVGFHHGKSLRWRGWPSDGLLADAGALCTWMEAHGAKGVCDEE